MSGTDFLTVITGASGFLGSHLVERCLHWGHTVFALSRFSSGFQNLASLKVNPKLIIIKDNVVNPTSLKTLSDVDVVFHLVANTDVEASICNPLQDLITNTGGTINLLEWARKRDLRFILFSTGSVYGEPIYVPIDENHPLFPFSPYIASKLAAEEYCKLYSRMYGLDTVILRIFSPYGPRQPIRKLIPSIISNIINNKPVVIHGDGNQTRAFLYVCDAIEAALMTLKKGKRGEIYNIGSDEATSINEVVRKISGILKKDAEVVHREKRLGDIGSLIPSVKKAKNDLGFVANTNLIEGLMKTIHGYYPNESMLKLSQMP